MAIDYNVFYASKGAAYRDEKIVKWSHYKQPVDKRPGRVGGNSRIWGDASHDTQRTVINKLIAAAKKDGFNTRRIAMLLAMAYIESGFNPDAAAGTTSASGLGQFIDDTGAAYGLTASNRFDVDANVAALIDYFKVNEKIAKKKGKPDTWVYKYHHDGPTKDYGGETLVNQKFAPLTAKFEKALNVGHALTVVDPAGAPIADAHIQVSQNGKKTVLKTNEQGLLPTFLAHPEFGPVNICIKKDNGEFKPLGELNICRAESTWTLVAPAQHFKVKTHVHEPQPGTQQAAPETHKVRAGETLSRIASDNETTYQELAKLNGIEKPYTIFPDQILKLPPKKGAKAAAKPAAPAAAPKAAPAAPAAAHGAPAAAPAPHPAHSAPHATAPAAAPTASAPAHQPARPAAQPAHTSSPAPQAARPAAPAAGHPAAPAAAAPQASRPAAQASPAQRAKPVVQEKRSAETQHPEAKVLASMPSDRIRAAITYAMANKKSKSIGYCLKYVKRALVASHLFAKYPPCEHAKDFGPYLEKEGFVNLLVTKPNINLLNAPIGSVIIYRPVEKQTYSGGVISGHIEIKHEDGYVSDFNANNPTYATHPTKMKSPVHKRYKVSFEVTGIWYKE